MDALGDFASMFGLLQTWDTDGDGFVTSEEFQQGLMVGITERTEPHILPLQPGEVTGITVRLVEEQAAPRPGSFFNWLLRKSVPLNLACYFAGAREYEVANTEFVLQTNEHPIRCWGPADVYQPLRQFFEKSQFSHLLQAAP